MVLLHLFLNKLKVSAKDYANLRQNSIEQPASISDHLPSPRGWPLNGGLTVIPTEKVLTLEQAFSFCHQLLPTTLRNKIFLPK